MCLAVFATLTGLEAATLALTQGGALTNCATGPFIPPASPNVPGNRFNSERLRRAGGIANYRATGPLRVLSSAPSRSTAVHPNGLEHGPVK